MTVEAGEIEAHHVGARRQRQPPLKGGVSLGEAAKRQKGTSEEMQGHVELRIEPMGLRETPDGIFVPTLKVSTQPSTLWA
ncbi:hypothetical protein [Sinorhizobium mexicanum]|uniref:hypothetical protein n=1 Tax=Sinorhizobium mexicanum TaxID=375549 RepID=UPI001DB6A0AB|nr:hypothetical protein [Sinorhizobium mexicanum]